MRNPALQALSKEQLMTLIEAYSKNWVAMDGLWFQSVEREFGMEAAMKHDVDVWRQFTRIEARRIKTFLKLSESPGLDGLEKALALRFDANFNTYEILREEHALVYRTLTCRVQEARKRKGMEPHPCMHVGIVEYEEFAKEIDARITCKMLSCFPQVTDSTCCCAWRYTLL